MEFSSACDSIEDYCLVLYVCTNDNYVWGERPFARELGVHNTYGIVLPNIFVYVNARFRPEGEVRLGSCLCMKCNIMIDL